MELNEIYMRDPFVFTENGVAYLVGTTDENAWGGKAHGFLGYRSNDLIDFEGPFPLFEANETFWADENFWAPELHKYRGKYYLFASFKKEGRRRASQCLVSDSPLGRYTPLKTPFTPSEWECLDATLYVENGVPYTVFCHEWLQVENGEMVLGQLNENFETLIGEPRVLFKASDAPWTRSGDGKCFVTDGPFLHRLKSGKLLMLWSSGGENGYAMGMSVSENGIFGPWHHRERPLISKDGGHGMIFEFQNKLYVIYHQPNEPHMSERPHIAEIYETDEDVATIL